MPPPKYHYDLSITCEGSKKKFPLIRFRRQVEAILRAVHFPAGGLQISLLSDAQIQKINRQFLNHDWATDVISFGYLEKGKKPGRKDQIGPALNHGDIAISLDTAGREARRYGVSAFYETVFYACHGILHILGWEDDTKGKRAKMLKRQEQLLEQIGIRK